MFPVACLYFEKQINPAFNNAYCSRMGRGCIYGWGAGGAYNETSWKGRPNNKKVWKLNLESGNPPEGKGRRVGGRGWELAWEWLSVRERGREWEWLSGRVREKEREIIDSETVDLSSPLTRSYFTRPNEQMLPTPAKLSIVKLCYTILKYSLNNHKEGSWIAFTL